MILISTPPQVSSLSACNEWVLWWSDVIYIGITSKKIDRGRRNCLEYTNGAKVQIRFIQTTVLLHPVFHRRTPLKTPWNIQQLLTNKAGSKFFDWNKPRNGAHILGCKIMLYGRGADNGYRVYRSPSLQVAFRRRKTIHRLINQGRHNNTRQQCWNCCRWDEVILHVHYGSRLYDFGRSKRDLAWSIEIFILKRRGRIDDAFMRWDPSVLLPHIFCKSSRIWKLDRVSKILFGRIKK